MRARGFVRCVRATTVRRAERRARRVRRRVRRRRRSRVRRRRDRPRARARGEREEGAASPARMFRRRETRDERVGEWGEEGDARARRSRRREVTRDGGARGGENLVCVWSVCCRLIVYFVLMYGACAPERAMAQLWLSVARRRDARRRRRAMTVIARVVLFSFRI